MPKLMMHERWGDRWVLVINTGGTIGMKKHDKGLKPEPNAFVKELREMNIFHDAEYAKEKGYDRYENTLVLSSYSKSDRRVVYTLLEYDPLLDSSNMTTKDWAKIGKDIEKNYEQYDGFVILHGTDTMAYTSSALSFMCDHLGKPVILTGSQVPIYDLWNDARDNLLGALLLAGLFDIPEVCLYFRNKLYRGNRVTKVDAGSFDGFASPNLPPLAKMDMDVTVYWDRLWRAETYTKFCVSTKLNCNVGLLRLFPGITTETVRLFLQHPIVGVVLETYGTGNAPDNRPELLAALKGATDRGVIIINTTQCLKGTVSKIYATGEVLYEAGLLPGRDMTPEAVLTKLSYVLAIEGLDLQTKKMMMVENLRGEMSADLERRGGGRRSGGRRSGRRRSGGRRRCRRRRCRRRRCRRRRCRRRRCRRRRCRRRRCRRRRCRRRRCRRRPCRRRPCRRRRCRGLVPKGFLPGRGPCLPGAWTKGGGVWHMAEDSGIDNPMEKWMNGMFGKWKGLLMAVLSSLACFVGIVVCSAPLMPLLDCLDLLPLDDQMVPANFDGEYGLPRPATPDFEYELPYTLPTPAIDCVPAEPDIYPCKWDLLIALSKMTDKASLILNAVPQELEAIRDALVPPLACAAAKIGDVEALESIREMGSILSLGDCDGRTPLHVAASEGHLKVVQYLLEHGSTIHGRDRHGDTPLSNAVLFRRKDIVRLLRKTGAHLSREQLAVLGTKLCSLAAHGDLDGLRIWHVAGADLNAPGYDGQTALSVATGAGKLEAVAMLNRLLSAKDQVSLVDE
ncbi:60 kDa lysophospholipase-like [Gadus macrocephalus]|uniref:60 kDa lysophospholipase-like n=1 Tax=Gadus macrocephalus TaxID=80720 RepID=UPI0028CB9B67|nr:60 kDa lysophospholipase-like [Gadus macrocephalus]